MKSINKDGSINKFSQIRENAFNLFLTRPFSEITMQDVANKAKISRPTLYKYFDNIDQIIFTLEESIMKNLLSDTRSAVAQQAQNGKELVLDFAKSSFEQAQREEEEFYFISLFDNYNHSRAADDSMNEPKRPRSPEIPIHDLKRRHRDEPPFRDGRHQRFTEGSVPNRE